ncbi:Crp/Fnr family transcriptional regulator [Helicobacter sp. Faydin-H64]|uniref:Crp/Fnr family transcriptional regulator n=1 Tax=Helicobacter turcicus TaxID=2867412 RepID=A0ABS7JNE1_9HELI|nr:Crp/Fnr family transcriptional regulator [Helicobacter turcicus]MBX7545769.1 Crp/Fnr family transcriptional regulator [Helicobacter turcicus]
MELFLQNSNPLANYAPFNTLSQETMESLLTITTFKTYKQKEIILYEEEVKDSLFFLLEGAVKLYKVGRFENEVFLGILESGLLMDFKFEFHTFSSFCNIECIKDSYIACFQAKKLHTLLEQNQEILTLFFKATQHKLELFTEVIQKELIFDGTAKLAYTLFYQLDSFNARKKQENAALLNIQPETLSRILKKLHRDAILSTDAQGKIKILDFQRLQYIFKQETL